MSDGAGVTPERFRLLVDGVLAVWGCDVEAEHDGLSCRFLSAGGEVAGIGLEPHPFGTVWRVRATGGRDRVHQSVVAALRTLRGVLAPDRGGGRVLFVRDGPT